MMDQLKARGGDEFLSQPASNHYDVHFKTTLVILHARYASIKLTFFLKGEGKMITNQPKATQTHLINKQPDLIPHFQAAIDCSYVQDIPSSDLSVLHRKLSFLRGVKEETNT